MGHIESRQDRTTRSEQDKINKAIRLLHTAKEVSLRSQLNGSEVANSINKAIDEIKGFSSNEGALLRRPHERSAEVTEYLEENTGATGSTCDSVTSKGFRHLVQPTIISEDADGEDVQFSSRTGNSMSWRSSLESLTKTPNAL